MVSVSARSHRDNRKRFLTNTAQDIQMTAPLVIRDRLSLPRMAELVEDKR